MTATATTISNVGAGLAAALATVDELARVYAHPPRDLDELPAVALALPTISRPPVQESEGEVGGHLGVAVWEMEWPIALYVRHDDPETAQAESELLAALLVQAVDDNYRLPLDGTPTVNEAKLVALEPEYLTNADNR